MKMRVVFVHETIRFNGLKTSYEFDLESKAKAFVFLCMKKYPEWTYDLESMKTEVEGE